LRLTHIDTNGYTKHELQNGVFKNYLYLFTIFIVIDEFNSVRLLSLKKIKKDKKYIIFEKDKKTKKINVNMSGKEMVKEMIRYK
jgi:hypothetical protein